MESKMTIEEVLKVTADLLEGIPVPVKYTRTIGEPVSAAVENLRECLKAIAEDRAAKDAAEGEDADVQD